MPDGKILELFLDERRASARIACPPTLVPAPGQYLLAHNPASDDPLAVPVFSAGLSADGFLAASPLPSAWIPGINLILRGPLGHGFVLPAAARRVALAAWDVSPAYLLGLIHAAQAQDAAIVLVCENPPDDLPSDVEIRPLAALEEISQWADYLALAATREALGQGVHAGLPLPVGADLRVRSDPLRGPREAQVLIVTPMPCGGLGKCGVCSVDVKGGVELACEAGPVFEL
jgi:dihydroorotate dehydrogenase electron transfer subunit